MQSKELLLHTIVLLLLYIQQLLYYKLIEAHTHTYTHKRKNHTHTHTSMSLCHCVLNSNIEPQASNQASRHEHRITMMKFQASQSHINKQENHLWFTYSTIIIIYTYLPQQTPNSFLYVHLHNFFFVFFVFFLLFLLYFWFLFDCPKCYKMDLLSLIIIIIITVLQHNRKHSIRSCVQLSIICVVFYLLARKTIIEKLKQQTRMRLAKHSHTHTNTRARAYKKTESDAKINLNVICFSPASQSQTSENYQLTIFQKARI